jgi:hypothetical protein
VSPKVSPGWGIVSAMAVPTRTAAQSVAGSRSPTAAFSLNAVRRVDFQELVFAVLRQGRPRLIESVPHCIRPQMAAVLRALLEASKTTDIDVETLKIIAVFCGVGLLVSLLFAICGLDLSVGFF